MTPPSRDGSNRLKQTIFCYKREESGAEMRGAGWILLGVAALWMSQLPLVSSHPTCSGPKQLNGSFMYELSEPHDSTCDTSWEDVHNKVIARNSDRDDTLVQSLTNQSITMKTCYHFLLYTRDCSGVQVMTNCSVNCTRLPEQSQNKSDPVNPASIFFPDDRTEKHERFGLCVFAVAVVAAVVIAVIVWLCIYKPRRVRQTETVSYSAPSEMVNLNQ